MDKSLAEQNRRTIEKPDVDSYEPPEVGAWEQIKREGFISENPDAALQELLYRVPRLVAHLMCTSLGYLTTRHACLVLYRVVRNEPHHCEWFDHMGQASCYAAKTMTNYDESMKIIARDTVNQAIESWERNKGYMAEYKLAIRLTLAEREKEGSSGQIFAGWF